MGQLPIFILLFLGFVHSRTEANFVCPADSKTPKVTTYFTGKCAKNIEGPGQGHGASGTRSIPCFSVACPKDMKPGTLVMIDGLKNVKCTSKSLVFEKILHTRDLVRATARSMKMDIASTLKCDEDSCINTQGIFRCDDTGGAIHGEGRFDLYIGMCTNCDPVQNDCWDIPGTTQFKRRPYGGAGGVGDQVSRMSKKTRWCALDPNGQLPGQTGSAAKKKPGRN